MVKKVLLINGVNLDRLGQREPHIYGSQTLQQIEQDLTQIAQTLGLECLFFQSNFEGEIVERIHQADQQVDFLIINAGAYTHTSVAIRDAISSVNIPFVEVHLSNIYTREPFRHHSYLSDKAVGVICGLGALGYQAALQFAAQYTAK